MPLNYRPVRKFFLVAICIGATSLSISLQAEGWSPRELAEEPGSFLSGLVSGVVIHEMGHFIVAKGSGYPVDHNGVSITYGSQNLPPHDQQRIASAGFQAQWIASEIAFSARENSNSNFAAGVICAHLGISAAYLTVLKDQPSGDSVGYANATGLSTDRIVLLAAIPAVLDAWRLFGDDVPKWVPALSIASKGVGITAIWVH
jgi:hypothetical protein